MIDRYTKIVLTVIAVALVGLLLRSSAPPAANASAPVEVKIVGTSASALAYAGPMRVTCDK